MNALTVVRGTMILATIDWAIAEALMRRSPRLDRVARACWSMGLALAVTHVLLAFHFVYAWNHEAAIAATARQTAEVVGWAWRDGIFVNYVFLAFWLVEAVWWWISPQSHASRSNRFEIARFALFVFMFINGAVVFASGVGRTVGVVSVAVALSALLRRRRPPVVG